MTEDVNNPADGKFVVIQGGQRVTGVMEEQQAIEEAKRRTKLAEAQGSPNPQPAEVKRNLFG